MNLHPKVRWAAVASALVAALIAALAAFGPSAPAWLGAVAAGIAAFAAGYAAPSDTITPGHAEAQDA